MVRVLFIKQGADAAIVRTLQASVLAVTDLVATHRLQRLGSDALAPAAGTGAEADAVAIELDYGVAVPGATGAGIYLVEGMAPRDAEREMLSEPGESGG